MKRLLTAFAFWASVLCLAPAAVAQSSNPPITTPDPGAFASTVSRQMETQGMQPIRSTFEEMFSPSGAPLPANIEAFLVTWERAVSGKRSVVTRKVDDVQLGDAVRQIYYYHYFGSNAWIFSRYDFVRISADRWALSALTLEDQWYKIAQTTSVIPKAN